MSRTSEFSAYPHLTAEEFSEVCHLFDRKYSQAKLGHQRKRWQLRVLSAFGMVFDFAADTTTYIQIVKPLEATLDHDELSSHLNNFSFGNNSTAFTGPGDADMADQAMLDAEESDQAALVKKGSPDIGRVVYEVHLHPTYQMPCLWFSLQGLPSHEPAFDIDTVFRRLVPDQFKDALRSGGPIGGISADHHPVTGIPSFFVHPCLLGDAMANFNCTKDDYMMTWLGLVGGCVGLWVPKEMAMDT